MNNFLTSIIWVTLGSSVASLALEHTEHFPTPEMGTVETRCPSNCQGDFPMSPGRKYAERETGTSESVRG